MRDVIRPNGATGKKLETWGEIASHLGVEVRTAQRWEKRMQLPVRRLDGGQAVYAFTDDLDRWLAERERIRTENLATSPARSDSGSSDSSQFDQSVATSQPIAAEIGPGARRWIGIGVAAASALVIGVSLPRVLPLVVGGTSSEPDTFSITLLSPPAGSVAFGGNVEPQWGVYVDVQYSLRSRDTAWLCIIAEVDPAAQSGSVCGDVVQMSRGTGTATTRVVVTNTTTNGPVLTKRLRLIVAAENLCRPVPGNFRTHPAGCFANPFFERVHEADFAWTHPGASNRVGVLAVSAKAGDVLPADTEVRVTVSYLLQNAPRAGICIRPVTTAPPKPWTSGQSPVGPRSSCSNTEVPTGFGTATASFSLPKGAASPVSTTGLWIEMKGLYWGYYPLPLNWTAPPR